MKSRFFVNKPRLVFFLCYTLFYILAVKAAAFVLPILTALLIAVVMKPLYDYLRRRFRFRSTFAATALTLLIFGAVFAAIGFFLFLIIRQALSLLSEYSGLISDWVRSPELLDSLKEQLLTGDLLHAAASAAKTIFQAVPLALTFVIFTFWGTVSLLHHGNELRDRLLLRAGEYRAVLDRILHIASTMARRFIRSYLILYVITFAEAALIFLLTGVEYPLAFAFVTAVADILPVLGPGTVYVPLSVSFVLQRNYIPALVLAAGFLLTAVIRQILEPRIVSDNIKIPPLAVLAAVYFSIVTMNLWVLFYVISLFMVFRVMNQAGVFEKG